VCYLPFGFVHTLNYVNTSMKLSEIIGPAPPSVCRSSTPNKSLPSSWLASCKSQGLRAREGEKSHKIGSKRITVGGKKIKGKKYGGPLKDYS
tara:strand:- start:730 stop:1005 length:276 start_codon:yes stop_codon:yes gene_type:complete